MSRSFFVVLGLLTVGVLVLCAGQVWMFQVPAYLAFGWIASVAGVVPRVTVNGVGVASFAIAVALAAWLAQGLGGWLWNDATSGRRWRWKWTAIGLATVLLMFTAGMAATGVTHQTAWLLAGREPLAVSSWQVRVDLEVARCESNVRQIAQAMLIYSAANGGYVPIDQADLVRVVASEGGQPEWFVCGDERFGSKPATRSSDWVAHVSEGDRYFTYHYYTRPIVGPDGKRRVRMCDREIHYFGGHMGLVVLYDDGVVESLDGDEARGWLKDRFALTPDFDGMP